MLTTLRHHSLRIVVRTTTCIVTTPPLTRGDRNVLVVPANSDLCGTKLPYFPHPDFPAKSKDVPPSTWGGVEMGSNTFYPVQCIDGVLQLAAPNIRSLAANHRCNVGCAFVMDCEKTRKLLPYYDAICHVVPPLWKMNAAHHHEQRDVLGFAYASALSKSLSLAGEHIVVSLPLLGCGARCAPPQISVEEAVKSIVNVNCQGRRATVEFALQSQALCTDLLSAFTSAGICMEQ